MNVRKLFLTPLNHPEGRMDKIHLLTQFYGYTAVVIVLLLSWLVSPAIALSPAQRNIFDREIDYYDVAACGDVEAAASAADVPTGGGPVYMMGDSITAGAKANLLREFGDATIDVAKIDGVGSRSFISRGEGATNGLEAIESGKAQIQQSKTVILALGTNSEDAPGQSSTFKKNAEKALDNIKEFNPGAKIYWVDIFGDSPPLKHKADYNTVIRGLPGVTVIEADKAGITLDSSRFHPDAAGYKKYAQTVVNKVKSESPKPSTGPGPADLNLSLREKIGQLMFVGVGNKDEAVALAKKYQIGGIMLIEGGTSLFSKSAIDAVKAAGKQPVLVASDEEGGRVQRLESKTGKYPSAKELGGKTDQQVESIAQEYGTELAELGVTVNYAPVLDIDDGSNSIISKKDRAFSSNPDTIAKKAGAFAKGMRSAGVAPVFKHFPGHGRADGDSHTTPVTTPHINSLKASDLKPYETLLKGQTSGVMVGHLIVPGLTNGKQATISPQAIELLRDDYNFDGVVFSDEIANMKAIADKYSPAEAVSLAIQAGIDMPLFNKSPKYSNLDDQVSKTIDKVEQDVKSGLIKESDIDSSLQRIQELKGVGTTNAKKVTARGQCVCDTATDGEDESLTGADNIEKAYRFFVDEHNFSPELASAFIGNFRQESGSKMDPTIINGIGAIGIAQWLDRRPALEAYAESKSKSPKSLGLQLDFVIHELKGSESAAYTDIKAVQGSGRDYIAAVTHTIRVEYERPGEAEANDPQRIKYALQVYDRYGQSGGGGGADEVAAGAANCADANAGGSGATGQVIDGYAWPVDLSKKEVSGGYPLPCRTSSCHHDGTPAFDLAHKDTVAGGADGKSAGKAVFAITDGSVSNVRTYQGINGCYALQFTSSKDGFKYWYGHLRKPVSTRDGKMFKAGDKIAEIGERKCTGNGSYPHLHIDRGSPKGSYGGSVCCRDQGMIEVINKLYGGLPD